jgi:flagellar hook-basal body complex protein FliE
MRIDASSNLLTANNIQFLEQSPKTEPGFGTWLGQHITETNHELNTADKALVELASGRAESLHGTMLALEEAKLSFQFMEQIRNRLMSAYQELLREQI